MPKKAKELSPLEVKRLEHPGKGGNVNFAVGGVSGLLLQVTPSGGRTWLLRVQVGAKRRELGLGGYPDVSLAMARDRARDAKDQIRRGIDPVEARKAAKAALAAAQRRGLTFKDAVDKCLAAKLDAFKNAKHRQQWENTLATYAIPEIGTMLVSEIATQDVLRVIEPIWREKTETASRLRGRIEAVLSWATVAGHRTGDNPARWAGNLKELLPEPSKVAKQDNQPAVSLTDAPAWFTALKKRDGTAARALEFLALCASRSGEVRGATFDEMRDLDGDAPIWVIPGSRMKAGREHRVPLTPEAVAIVKSMPRLEGSPYVFAAPRGGQLSDMSISAVMRRMHEAETKAGRVGWLDPQSGRPAVPHGLRSTFRDWVSEQTTFPGDMAEVALAHKISNAVEASYRRGDQIEKRRGMMQAWNDFVAGRKAEGAIIRLRAGA